MHCMNVCVCVCVCECVCLSVLCWGDCTYTCTKKPGKIQMQPFSLFKPTLSGKNPSRFWPLSPAPITTTLKLSSPASKAGIRKNSGSCPHSTRGSSQTTTREQKLTQEGSVSVLPLKGLVTAASHWLALLTDTNPSASKWPIIFRSVAIHCLSADRGQKVPAIRVHLWAMLQPQFPQLWNGKNNHPLLEVGITCMKDCESGLKYRWINKGKIYWDFFPLRISSSPFLQGNKQQILGPWYLKIYRLLKNIFRQIMQKERIDFLIWPLWGHLPLKSSCLLASQPPRYPPAKIEQGGRCSDTGLHHWIACGIEGRKK